MINNRPRSTQTLANSDHLLVEAIRDSEGEVSILALSRLVIGFKRGGLRLDSDSAEALIQTDIILADRNSDACVPSWGEYAGALSEVLASHNKTI